MIKVFGHVKMEKKKRYNVKDDGDDENCSQIQYLRLTKKEQLNSGITGKEVA